MASLERILAPVFPTWALKRMQAKRAFQISERAYAAAKTGRRTDGWLRSKTSARAETGPAIVALRGSVRDLVRNNPHASIALRRLTTSIMGEGIKPRFDGLKKGPKQKLTERWNLFVENADPEGLLDLYGLQALATRVWLESGEALIRFHPRRAEDGFKSPLQISILEPDHIDHAKNQIGANGNVILQGVEYDKFGRRVAYWIFSDHPGDAILVSGHGYKSSRISAEFIQPLFERLRPGQIHGVPMMTAAVMALRDLSDYEDAERMRKKIAACFAVFVQNDGDTVTDTSTTDAKDRQVETISPGMIKYLKDGESVIFGEPSDSGGYAEYMKFQLHAVAAGCGLSYHELTGDLSSANYSSLREGKLQSQALVRGWQAGVVEPMMCRPIFNAWFLLAGALEPLPKKTVVKWSRPFVPWVDPKKDAEAERMDIRAGTKTWRKAVADKGSDPDEVLLDIAEHQARLDDLGIVLESDARQPINGGGSSANKDDQETDDAKDAEDAEDDEDDDEEDEKDDADND